MVMTQVDNTGDDLCKGILVNAFGSLPIKLSRAATRGASDRVSASISAVIVELKGSRLGADQKTLGARNHVIDPITKAHRR